MARTRRLEELSILNVLFCLLVVLIHVLSQTVSSLDKTSWQYATVLIPQRLAFVSVPGFFFLSGVKLTLPRAHRQSLGAYYWGRVKNLLLPYLLAAAAYYLFFVIIGWYAFSPLQFLHETALGRLSGQFYFLVALAQYILLTPLFQRLARQYHPVVLLPLALGITWLSSMHFNSILQLFRPDIAFPYSDRVFTTYLIYYMAGCCAGEHYQSFLTLLKENRTLICTCAIFFGAADGIISLLAFSGRRNAPYLELIHTLYILYAIPALSCLALQWKETHSRSSSRTLSLIDQASYLIYLYHCLFITIFNLYARRITGGAGVQLLLRIAVVYPVTIIGCVLWQKLWAAIKKHLLFKTKIENSK